jgi:DnaK suppressor protein
MLAQATIAQQEHRLMREMDHVRTDLQIIGSRCMRDLDWSGDVVDRATHMVELFTDRALHRLYQQELKQLEQAWTRCHTGQYGVCESCGAQINPARLDALPSATFCVRCQRRREQ